MKNFCQKLIIIKGGFILLLLVIISCSKKAEENLSEKPEVNLSVLEESIVYSESGGVQNINIKTNGDNIAASIANKASWASCEVAGNTVVITTDPLPTLISERTADVIITATKGVASEQRIIKLIQRFMPDINRDSVFVVPNADLVVEGYLTVSKWYGYSYNDIDYSNVTHINFASMVPKSETDPTIVYSKAGEEAEALAYYPDLVDKTFLGYGDKLIAKAHAANVKVLMAVTGAKMLRTLLANTTLRMQFASNLVTLLEQKGYDGIALDYEYPESNSEGSNILLLMQDLRVAFAKSAILAPKKMFITMAVPTGSWAAKYYDVTALAKYVDWFSPMTYEYSSTTIANVNSPLYKNAAKGNNLAIDDAVNYYLNTRNVDPMQLTIGVPFYGAQYTNFTALGASATGALRSTAGMYKDHISQGGFTEMWDDVTQHSYYVNSSTNMMIVYDNEKDMATKADYLKAKGLKGAMIWELSRGFYDNGTTKNPWLKALGEAVLH